MAALHTVLTLDVAGAAVMALNMVADCEACDVIYCCCETELCCDLGWCSCSGY